MARYKHVDYNQTTLVPVDFTKQIIPGTFSYSLSLLIDKHIQHSVFDKRYKNDNTGAPAYSPAILLKIILFAYYNGIKHSSIVVA